MQINDFLIVFLKLPGTHQKKLFKPEIVANSTWKFFQTRPAP